MDLVEAQALLPNCIVDFVLNYRCRNDYRHRPSWTRARPVDPLPTIRMDGRAFLYPFAREQALFENGTLHYYVLVQRSKVQSENYEWLADQMDVIGTSGTYCLPSLSPFFLYTEILHNMSASGIALCQKFVFDSYRRLITHHIVYHKREKLLPIQELPVIQAG